MGRSSRLSRALVLPAFLAGAVLYLYRDKVPDSGWLALGFIVLFVAGSGLPLFGEGETRFLHFLPGPI